MAIKISVVVPTYKRPALLARCLHAILDQTLDKTNYEIIVVSDGPDQATEFMTGLITLEGGLPSITYLALSHKKGPAAARNKGWQSASGELIVFTDDDCIPTANWLYNYWSAYQEAQTKDIVFTGKVSVPIPARPTDYEKNISLLETASFITANCACSKIALEKVNGFDEAFSYAWREDSALEFELLNHQVPIIKIQNAMVEHPIRQAKWGVSLKEQKKGMFNALLYKKHPAHYKNKISSQPQWNYYIMVISAIIFSISILLGKLDLGIYFLLIWIFFLAKFVLRRLRGTSHSFSHVMEMIFTSICIPFASIYWTIFGAVRFKVFHL